MHDLSIERGPYEPTWDSLRGYTCPEWFRDAKLGIWAHWGPQSVPMYGDWYARHMYVEGSDQYRYHLRTYGHPSQFGYKDIIARWKAERFDPEALMRLYVDAGARYFMAQAAHHDNFHNWKSQHHRWNSVAMGPGKDIVGLWREAARQQGLRFGLSEHMGASFAWWVANKGADVAGPWAGVPYDGNDPAYEDLYLPNRGATGFPQEWYTANPWWQERWFTYAKELVDVYQPDLLYSDGGVPFGEIGLRLIAHLYNTSARLHHGDNEAVYTQKDRDPQVFAVGVLDIECSQLPTAMPYIWQTDTFIGNWFYDVRAVYKTPKHVAEILVDVVSKNGNLLLNIPQRPDGTIDDECRYILDRMAGWISVNGEGIYGTRPWQIAAEGPSRVVIDRFKEEPVEWTSEDFRFTAKDGVVYAFQLQWPEDGKTVIRSLASGSAPRIATVALLGHGGSISFEQTGQGLAIDLPEQKPCDYTHCFRVTFA
jgi:alpha-L-fucosidase